MKASVLEQRVNKRSYSRATTDNDEQTEQEQDDDYGSEKPFFPLFQERPVITKEAHDVVVYVVCNWNR